ASSARADEPVVAVAAPVTTSDASAPDAFADGSTPPWMANKAASTPAQPEPMIAAEPAAAAPATMATSPTENLKRETKSGSGSFRIALGAMGGGGGYSETIDSTRDAGDRNVKVSFAPQLGGQLELEHAIGLRFNFQYWRQIASVKPDETDPPDIDLKTTHINGRVSYALMRGDYPIAILAGVKNEKTDAGDPENILWVPDSKLISTLLGASLSYGDLASRGTTFEVIAAAVPYGKHTRTAETTELSSRALGGLLNARVRYQWPKALGSSAGFFIEAAGNARYLTFSAGDVTLPTPPDNDASRQQRVNALPIGDDSSRRLDYGLTASIGLMWRPGD
ncbi:MAG: hypothetical protein H7Z43_00380, partial [Clostridia bacterium]|nr:hypothetical protein [Deltaproteobacteria bacterium]